MSAPGPISSMLASSVYRRALRFLYPHRAKFLFALAMMAVYGATEGAIPLLIREILDKIFGERDERMLYLLPIIILVFAIIRGFCGFSQQYLSAAVGLNVTRDMRNSIQQQLLRLSPRFFETVPSGSLISRVTNDTLLVRLAINDALSSLVRDTIRVVALLGVAIYLDPLLGAITFVGLPIAVWPVLRYGKKVRRLSKVGQEQFSGLTGVLQENIQGHKIVQSFCMQGEELRRFENENQKLTDTLLRAEKYGALSGPTNEILASMLMAGVILYGGLSVIGGVRTQGDFIAFITSMFLLYEPLKKLGRVTTTLQMGLAASERIFEVLDVKSEIVDSPNATTLNAADLEIKFEKVSFRYQHGGSAFPEEQPQAVQEVREWALQDVSFNLQSGNTLALVGMSGGGKSTLVQLLTRFYDPTAGRITIGGKDIRDVRLESLRSAIAIVSQHTFLFNCSVEENIRYGRLGASDEEVIAAAKAAYAHNFIEQLPEGYRTIVGEQGMRLSGGERARVAIARAILKNAPILILDEATASLDSESENLVQTALENLMNGKTTIVIAHRLSTIRSADAIAVIVHGRIVEYGSHQELLERGGEYSKLYRLQFQPLANDVVSEASNG